MGPRWFEREEDRLEKALAAGEITQREYQEELREMNYDYRAEIEDG